VETAILVRHGESEASVRGVVSGEPTAACPLTEVGRRQARELGRLLAEEEIDVCLTSEFPRTIETADLALDGREIPRAVLPELNDPRAGGFEGGEFLKYREWAGTADSAARPLGGESRRELVARYVRGYRKVLDRPERTVLVVGHSLATSYVLEAMEGREPTRIIPLIPYAQPKRLTAEDLYRAVRRLEAWSKAPTW
jgi:broad specificity phosphatase PhoE